MDCILGDLRLHHVRFENRKEGLLLLSQHFIAASSGLEFLRGTNQFRGSGQQTSLDYHVVTILGKSVENFLILDSKRLDFLGNRID